MNQPSVRKLIDDALAAELGSARQIKLVAELQRRGDRETFDEAVRLTQDTDVGRRILGVDVLGQLGSTGDGDGTRPFHTDTVQLLLGLLQSEADPSVIESIAVALGHLKDPKAADQLSRLAEHPNPEVRRAAAFGLGELDDARAERALLALTADPAEPVRDWATFALGTLSKRDTPELRDVLISRLKDPSQDVREEALRGLAKRGDPRAIEAALDAVAYEPKSTDGLRLEESIIALGLATGERRLCRPLLQLRTSYEAVDEPLPTDLVAAIDRCCPPGEISGGEGASD